MDISAVSGIQEGTSGKDRLHFDHLPAYADFLLGSRSEAFAIELLRLCREEDIPLLRYFAAFTEQELLAITNISAKDMLSFISRNKAGDYITKSTIEWKSNQLKLMEREQVLVEDIALINFVKRKAFRNMLSLYTNDITQFASVMHEADVFTAISEAASFNAYLEIQQEKISLINHELESQKKEMMEAQQLLEQSEELHRQAESIIHVGNWLWDIATGSINWSDEMYRIYGLEPQSEKITFERFMSLVHPDDRERRQYEIMESLRTGRAEDYLLRIVNPDGKLKILKGRGKVLSDENRQPTKIIGVCQDITAEEALHQELKEKDQNLEMLIHNAPDAVIVINEKSLITLWNPRATQVFGWTAEEAMDKPLTETIIPPRYHHAHLTGMNRYIKTGHGNILNKTQELTARNKDGVEFYVSLTISRMGHGDNISFIAFLRDISEEKSTRMELENKTSLLAYKNMELERTNQELESFNYAASHDLQEPLRKIHTYSSRILDNDNGRLTEEQQRDFKRIISASVRMQQLIKDLLTFSQSTSLAEVSIPVDLNALMEEVKSLLALTIEEKRAVIVTGELPVINVVPFQFQQVFANLLGNAMKYQQENVAPQIHIHAKLVNSADIQIRGMRADKNYLQISIGDNGIGFENHHAEKIFDLFTRLHTKDKYSGTGIGLALCKKVIHNHEGFITASSEEGKGTTFYIYLPADLLVRK